MQHTESFVILAPT